MQQQQRKRIWHGKFGVEDWLKVRQGPVLTAAKCQAINLCIYGNCSHFITGNFMGLRGLMDKTIEHKVSLSHTQRNT